MSHIETVQFRPEFREEVVDVIGKNLANLKIVPADSLPIDDEDLFHIPEVYSGKSRFWVALEDNKVVGTVGIKDKGEGTAKLKRMFVLMDHHGKGVGLDLLNTAIEFAREQGFKQVILNTNLNMHRAHHFYENNGFKRTGQEGDRYSYKLEL